MKKIKSLSFVLAFSTLFLATGIAGVSVETESTNPIIIVGDQWQVDYDYGYWEGKRYKERGDYAGYKRMYDYYVARRIQYGDSPLNYQARILGLVDGWMDGSTQANPSNSGGSSSGGGISTGNGTSDPSSELL